jgi:succinate dehydrogenase hydrophobic anchor subunit
MGPKSLGQLEEHAAFILFMAFILTLLWHGIWGVADNIQEYIHNRFGIKPWQFNAATILLAVLIIGVYPQILEKI